MAPRVRNAMIEKGQKLQKQLLFLGKIMKLLMRLEDKIFRVDPAEGNDPFLRSRAALSDFPF